MYHDFVLLPRTEPLSSILAILRKRPAWCLVDQALIEPFCDAGRRHIRVRKVAEETRKWLRKLLSQLDPEAEYVTAHSLKSTPLSWCAKWGLDPEVRLILGHHKTGKASAECYGRDNLAKPLRDFDLVLQQIRTKAFVPDSTRSGMIQHPSKLTLLTPSLHQALGIQTQ